MWLPAAGSLHTVVLFTPGKCAARCGVVAPGDVLGHQRPDDGLEVEFIRSGGDWSKRHPTRPRRERVDQVHGQPPAQQVGRVGRDPFEQLDPLRPRADDDQRRDRAHLGDSLRCAGMCTGASSWRYQSSGRAGNWPCGSGTHASVSQCRHHACRSAPVQRRTRRRIGPPPELVATSPIVTPSPQCGKPFRSVE